VQKIARAYMLFDQKAAEPFCRQVNPVNTFKESSQSYKIPSIPLSSCEQMEQSFTFAGDTLNPPGPVNKKEDSRGSPPKRRYI